MKAIETTNSLPDIAQSPLRAFCPSASGRSFLSLLFVFAIVLLGACSDTSVDNNDPDRDDDGISNVYEEQVGTDPDDASSTPPDRDGDGVPDQLDEDIDGDGVSNADDVFPLDPTESADLDADGIGDNSDSDRDGDGFDNDAETAAGTDPSDASSFPATTPATGPAPPATDTDGDGIPDSEDMDIDNDGYINAVDQFPLDPNEHSDLDGDGIGDNSDPDRDNDGYTNDAEIAAGSDPNDPNSIPSSEVDTDGDGIPDSEDIDIDNDGFINPVDKFPLDPNEHSDLDNDGIGDNSDPDRDGDGVNNDLEIEAGTDPDDPGSTPPDLDGDGIPDLLSIQFENVPGNTVSNSIVVSGQLLVAGAGIERLQVSNNRYPDQHFAVSVLDNNRFTGEVPLKTGDNTLTVTLVNTLDQSAQDTAQVKRQADALPSVEITSHRNNQVVTSRRIDLRGRLYTTLGIGELQFFVNEQPALIQPVMEQVYQFSLNNIELARGYNRLLTLAKTPAGNVETAIIIYYRNPEIDATAPLELLLSSPREGEAVNDKLLVVRGQLFNAGEGARLSVNGVDTALYDDPLSGLLFSAAIDISAVAEGPYSISLVAASPDKDALVQDIDVTIDRQPPLLMLNNPLLDPPQVNAVRQQPYRLSGSVSDANLTSLSINGHGVIMQATAGDSYTFDTAISLTSGEQTTLNIVASDRAGNETVREYQLLSNPQVTMEIIQPLPGTEYRSTGASHDIEFITRLTDLSASGGKSLVVSADTSEQRFDIVPSDTQVIIEGALRIDTADAIDSLRFEVRSSNDEILASSEVAISLVNLDTLPLVLEKTNPARNDKDREPHTPIQFYFNKPVTLADLAVSVKQTYHGKAYSNATVPGASLSNAYQGEVIDVNKDQEPVAGALSLLPGERIVEFYPERDISFGASVFVEISHQGRELARFIYQVRPNPTFIRSTVIDQNQQTLAGIEVAIPELGLSAKTDANGALLITSGRTRSDNIPSGLYRFVVNPGQANPAYGVIERLVRVEGGIVNRVGAFSVPALNPDVAWHRISSGVVNTLVGGDLEIDARQATLIFADGASQGNVHIQIADYGSTLYQAKDLELSPLWMYNLQPGNIRVRGRVGLRIRMPTLYGDMSYLPPDNSPVLIMGLDDASLSIVPVGVGVLDNGVVASQGELDLRRLDFIGVTLVDAAYYDRLRDVIAGRIGLSPVISEILEK